MIKHIITWLYVFIVSITINKPSKLYHRPLKLMLMLINIFNCIEMLNHTLNDNYLANI